MKAGVGGDIDSAWLPSVDIRIFFIQSATNELYTFSLLTFLAGSLNFFIAWLGWFLAGGSFWTLIFLISMSPLLIFLSWNNEAGSDFNEQSNWLSSKYLCFYDEPLMYSDYTNGC